MGITRFPNGINTAAKGTTLEELGILDPTKWVTFFDDFNGQAMFPLGASGVGSLDNANWDFDVTEGGGGNAAIAVVDGHGGFISLTCDVADNDLIFVQSKYEAFTPTAGKKLFFKTRLKINESLQSELYAGLMVRDTDPLSSTAGDGVTDGIFFMKEDGVATCNFYVQKNATTGQLTTSSVHTFVDDTFVTLGFYYNGKGSIAYYINDVKKAEVDGSSTYLPDTDLALAFGVKQGEITNAKVLTLDYIFVAAER